jgi:uncharacterized protein
VKDSLEKNMAGENIPRKIIVKYDKLKEILKQMESVVVAFSGGVDSTFLLKVSHDVLKDRAVGITIRSEVMGEQEVKRAVKFAQKWNIPHRLISISCMDNQEFVKNPPLRCYICKKDDFAPMIDIAREEGYNHVLDGSHAQDKDDYRPGLKALEELHIRSPLKEAGFVKEEIRILSKEMGLPTWNKPSAACLASRIPYGSAITPQALKQVDRAESVLRSLGFKQVRVRHHDQIARIEVPEEEFRQIVDGKTRKQIVRRFKQLGFAYITFDLEGYRTGSLNEVLES